MTERRTREAEKLFERALAVRERAVGPDHPDTATIHEQSGGILCGHRLPGEGAAAGATADRERARQLRAALPVLADAERKQLIPAEQAVDAMLNAIQRGAQSSAASAVNKLAVRLAAGNDRLAELVRRDQDLAAEAEALDKAMVAAVSKERSKRDPAAEQRAQGAARRHFERARRRCKRPCRRNFPITPRCQIHCR